LIWFITISLFVSLLAAAVAVRWLFFSDDKERADAMRQRLSLISTKVDPSQAALASLLRDRSYSTIPLLNRILASLPRTEKVRLLLHQAGNPCNVGTLVLLISTFALVGLFLGMWRGSLLLGAGLALGGIALPIISLRTLRKKRLNAFDEQFPEAVDLIARALRAGHSFNAALRVVGEEMDEPIAGEFAKTFDDYSYGKSVEDALGDLVKRVGLQDVKFFATAVIMQKETGGNLTEILDNMGYIIRERFSLMREVRALSAEGRLSGTILCLLAPGMLALLMMISPGYLGYLFEHPMGNALLIAGGAFQLVGMLVIKRLVNLKI
jgi:tight adherence protein B